MFCPKCGNEVKEGQSYCLNCGNRVSIPSNKPTEKIDYTLETKPKKGFNKKLLIPIIGVPIVVIVLCLFFFTNIFGRGPEATARAYFDAIDSKDDEKYLDLTTPEKMLERIMKEEKVSKKQLAKECKEQINYQSKKMKEYKFDPNSSYSLSRLGKVKKKYIDEQNKYYRKNKIDNVIQEAVLYEVKQKGAKSMYISLAKVNGKWYAEGFERLHELEGTHIDWD